MSNMCAVPRRPSTPGSPLDTVKKLSANPPLRYCMHAGSAASPQQSSHVQQHNTKQSARARTMAGPEGRQTASSRTLERGAEATEIFTEACFVAFVLSDWRRRAPRRPPFPTDSLSALWLEPKSPENKGWGGELKTVCLQNANIWLWVYAVCVYVGVLRVKKCVGVFEVWGYW